MLPSEKPGDADGVPPKPGVADMAARIRSAELKCERNHVKEHLEDALAIDNNVRNGKRRYEN